jgi:2'-hydroxyisoflavone reductase
VRPGYIVGPRDRSDRFTYWPMRVARGGEVLAPGDPTCEFQIIDVRDLGAWIVHAVENKHYGAYNTVGYRGSYTIEEMLHGTKCVLSEDATFTWVDDAFLADNKVTSWGDVPWTPKAELGHIDNRAAIAAGLSFRPIAETVRATYDWAKEALATRKARGGLTPEREVELLAAWNKR